MKEKLETLFINNQKWNKLLNMTALNGDKYFREKHYLDLIKKYMPEEDSVEIFKELLGKKCLKENFHMNVMMIFMMLNC